MVSINFKIESSKIKEFSEYHIISKINDHNLTMVKVRERTLDFHTHPDSDEAFYIIEGEMEIELRDRQIKLRAGDFFVVPKGVEHRPVCTTEVTCVLIEKENTLTLDNTGGIYV
jgi:mannose-6-phosphate isomerase-like protein (cupin superfamily)